MIQETRYGWRTRIEIAGREHSRRWRRSRYPVAPIAEMQAWEQRTLAKATLGLLPPTEDSTFADDAARYLQAVQAMPTYSERERDILLWVQIFGERQRSSIQGWEIRAVRDRWLLHGPKMVQRWKADPVTRRKVRTYEAVEAPLSASAVSHRLRALANLWTVLDGRHAPNPAREVPEPDEPGDEPRGLPLELVDAILAALPDQGWATKGTARLDVSKAKARLQVMAWTGLPPKQIGLLRAQDVDWDGGTVYVRRRRKGKGVVGQRRPFTALGIDALKALNAADAWGPFAMTPVRRAWQRACRKVQAELAANGVIVDLSHVVPYALRHSFATATLRSTGSLDAVQMLLGHADKRTSGHYALAAVPDWLAAAAKRLEVHQNRAKVTPIPATSRPQSGTTGEK